MLVSNIIFLSYSMGRSVADIRSRLAGVVGRRSTSNGALTREQVTEDWLRSPPCSPTLRPRPLPNLSNFLTKAIIVLQFYYIVIFIYELSRSSDGTPEFSTNAVHGQGTPYQKSSRTHPILHRTLHDAVITTPEVKNLKHSIIVFLDERNRTVFFARAQRSSTPVPEITVTGPKRQDVTGQ